MRILIVLYTILLLLAADRATADSALTTSNTATGIASTTDAPMHDSLLQPRTDALQKTGNEKISSDSEDVLEILIPIVFVVAASFVVFRSIESRRYVRLAMIEKGMNPMLSYGPLDESSRKFSALRLGMLLAGIGFGLLIAIVIVNVWPTILFVEGIFVGSSLLNGGLGLMVYHIIARRLEK